MVHGVVQDERSQDRNTRHAEHALPAIFQGPLHHELTIGRARKGLETRRT
jgi:hypothetical protein